MTEDTKEINNPRLVPTVLTVFGITGSLSKNKLLPALYHLLKRDMLPEQFRLIGIFRSSSIKLDSLMQQVEINLLRKHQDVDAAILAKLLALIEPLTMDSTSQDDYHLLKQKLDEMDEQTGVKYQRLFYLAIPPNIFHNVIDCLHGAGLNDESNGMARRILVEKPFGTDLQSARALVEKMSKTFQEQQIYRIDHYLAKENVQNILKFRFSNPLIEDIWGRQFIDHIQITASEAIGIDSRSNFYEGMGALRDIVQSHLLQLMSLVMMESPTEMTSDLIHAEKKALLDAIEPIKPNHVDELSSRGQYIGYREEVNNSESNTETFVALCLEVANSRWGGVPVLLRTGKSLDKQLTVIHVVFKDRSRRSLPANLLTIRIQPNEGISMSLTAKKPGFKDELQPVNMEFTYEDSFDQDAPDAYERVLIDCILGDQSLFASNDEVLRCWEILEPVLQFWRNNPAQPALYKKGSTGPIESNTLAASFGSDWL